MRLKATFAVLLLAFSLGSCRDSDSAGDADRGDRGATPSSAASGAGTATTASTAVPPLPSSTDIEWMRQFCAVQAELEKAFARVPELSVSPSGLTLAQRRSRAEALWPALSLAGEELGAGMKKIVPPERIRRIHDAIASANEVVVNEQRRSLSELDQIFESIESVDRNNARLMEAETKARRAVEDLLRADPPILVLWQTTLPECQVKPTASATPQ